MGDQPAATGPAEGARARRLRTALKWAFRACVASVISVLLLLHLLPVITDTAVVRGLVASRAAAALRDARVELRTLRVAPLRKRLLLVEGLTVAHADRPADPIVRVGRVECRWRPTSPLGGTVHVTDLEVSSVEVDLRRMDGRWNVLAILRPRTEPVRLEWLRLPLALRVDAARAEDVRLTLAIDDVLEATVDGVAVEGSCRIEGLLEGGAWASLSVAQASARHPLARIDLPDGVRARAEFLGSDGMANLSAAVAADAVQAACAPLGELAPVPAMAGLDVVLDLANLEVPQAAFDCQVPGLFADSLSASVTRDRGLTMRAENLLSLDLAALRSLLPDELPLPVRCDLSGRVLARTNVRARWGGDGERGAHVAMSNSLTGLDVAAGVEATVAGSGLRARVAGLRFDLGQQAEVVLSRGLAGLLFAEARGSVESVAVERQGLAALDGRDGEAQLAAAAGLPRPSALRLGGRTGWRKWTVASPLFGSFSLPVESAFALSGQDVLDPSAFKLSLDDARVSLGAVAPYLELSGAAAGGEGVDVSLSGRAAVDFGELLALTDRARGQGALSGAIQVAGHLDSDLKPHLSVSGLAWAEAADVAFAHGGAGGSVGRVLALGELGASAGGRLLPRGVTARAAVIAQDVGGAMAGESAVAVMVNVARAEALLSFNAPYPDLADVAVQGASSARDLAFAASLPSRGLAVGPLSLTAAGGLLCNPLAGDFQVSDGALSWPGVLEVAVPSFRLDGFGGEGLSGRAAVALPDIGALLDEAAAALQVADLAGLPTVKGSAAASVEVAGRLPLLEQIAASLEAGQPLPSVSVLPLDEFYTRWAPVDAEAELAVEDLSVSHHLAGGLDVGVSGVSAGGWVGLAQGDLAGGAEAAAQSVEFSPSPVPLQDFRAAGRFAVRDFNEFELSDCTLAGPGELMELTADVRGAGLGRIAGLPSAGKLLEALDLNARSSMAVRLSELPALAGLTAAGRATADVAVDLTGAQELRLTARPHLEDVSVSFRDLAAVEGLSGGLRLTKGWAIVTPGHAQAARPLSAEAAAPSPARAADGVLDELPEFATAADLMLGSREAVRAGSVRVLGREVVRDAAVGLALRGAEVSVPLLRLSPLGGDLVGRASLQAERAGHGFKAEGEFTGVDMRLLLPAELRDFRGDAQVNGSFALSVRASPPPADGARYEPLRDLSGRLALTRIGQSALDRALLALDPSAANPSIVRARRALLVARPLRAEASLQRGFLGLTIELQVLGGGLVTQYAIPRFSIMPLLNAPVVADVFRRAGPALRGLDLLSAEQIEVDADGGMRLR